MRALRYLLVFAAALMVAAVPLLSSSADADSTAHVIEGTVTLTEDVSYADGDTVTFANNSVLDVGSHTLTLGENTKVYIPFSASIVCGDGGSIVAGTGSSLVILGTAIKSFQNEFTFSFDGTLVFTQTSLITVDVAFADDSTVLNVAWGTSTLAVTGFKMTQEIASTENISRTIGFSALEYEGAAYDGGELVSTKKVTVESSDPDSTVVATIHYNGTLEDVSDDSSDITIADLASVTSVTTYASTGVVNTTGLTGLGPTQISVATTRMANIVTTADSMVVSKTVGTEKESETTMTGVSFTADVDIDKLLELMQQGIEGTTPDWLQYLNFVADTAVIEDYKYGTSHTLSDVSLTINPNDLQDRYLLAEATEGSDVYTLTATKVEIESYAITRDLVLDLKTSSTNKMDVTVEKRTDSVLVMKTEVADAVLDIDSLELNSLAMLYSRTGTMSIQHLLDHSDEISAEADTVTVDSDGDGTADTTLTGLSAVLCENTIGLYTLTVKFDTLDTSPVLNGETVTIAIGKTSLYLEASGSVAECLDFLLSGSHFTSDAHAELQLTNAGFSLSYPLDNGTITVGSEVISSTSPPDVTLILSIDHSTYKDNTALAGTVSFIGYALEAEVQQTYTDPDGTLDAVLTAMDGSGSFEFEFGTGIGFSASLNLPWSFALKYYGIDLEVVSASSGISLSHGSLDLDGFSTAESGVLDIPMRLFTDDFGAGFRLSLETGSLDVYRDGSTVPDISCTDLEISVRDVGMNLKRDVSLDLALNKITLAYVTSEGKQTEYNLERLNVNKDLSGAETGKGPLEAAMPFMLAVSIIAIIVLLFLLVRMRRAQPELFKMNENTDEEHYGIVPTDEDEPADWGDPSDVSEEPAEEETEEGEPAEEEVQDPKGPGENSP